MLYSVLSDSHSYFPTPITSQQLTGLYLLPTNYLGITYTTGTGTMGFHGAHPGTPGHLGTWRYGITMDLISLALTVL